MQKGDTNRNLSKSYDDKWRAPSKTAARRLHVATFLRSFSSWCHKYLALLNLQFPLTCKLTK